MSWIRDRLEERDAARKEWAAIGLQAGQVYDKLWKEVSDRATEAKNNGMLVGTNGSPNSRTVLLSVSPPGHQGFAQPKELTLFLKKDKQAIEVTSPGGSTTLSLAMDDDGIVHLEHQGEKSVDGKGGANHS